MKNLVLVFLLMFPFFGKSQINVDIYTDASFKGLFINSQITYPIKNKVIVGLNYGYNFVYKDIKERAHIVLGYKFDEQVQIEAQLGYLNHITDKLGLMYYFENHRDYKMNAYIGAKMFINNNSYLNLGFGSGLIRIGYGFRFRYKFENDTSLSCKY